MAFVKTVPEAQASGLVKEEYQKGIKRVGYAAQVLKVSSLVPEIMKGSIDFYLSLMHKPSRTARPLKEMIAVVVSGINLCHY
jgi:hypothetical protein